MRILMLADGRAVHTVRFQTELKRQGCTVFLASLEPGGTVDYSFKRPSGISGLDYTLASRELSNIIKDYRPDIINPHYASGYGYITALGDNRRVPAVMHCLGSDILIDPSKSLFQKARAKFVLKKIRRIIVDSQFLGDRARALNSGADYRVIYWGADERAFEVFRTRDPGAFAAPLRILVPRPHNKIYNNSFIIRALREPLRAGKIELSFPSWGKNIDAFKTVVDELCPAAKISYYDYMTRDEYNRFLGNFDVYLSASKSDSSPASLIEAMAAGLYPVAADIPGVREWLDGSNGSLYDLENPETLFKAIEYLFTNTSDIKDILIGNNKRAREYGRFIKNVAETLEIFRGVVEDDRW